MNRISFSPRLELRQTQALIMTPQLQQAIKMLQLSNLELAGFVDSEVERNPLLERPEASSPAAGDKEGEEPPSPAALSGALDNELAPDAAEQWGAATGGDGDGSADLGGDGNWHGRNGASFDGDDRQGLEQSVAPVRTLREHLLEQIGTDFADPGDRVIAVHVLDLLDEAGYLRGSLDAVAQLLGCDLGRVETVLARLQQCDPAGVFARDLVECLALQLRDRDRLDPAMQLLLDNLPLLAARNFAGLLRLCQVDTEDLSDMIAEIKSLDPRPGLAFDPPLAQPIVPDILLRASPKGGWIVELNAETLPRVLVNNRYYARVKAATRNRAEKEYLAEQLQAANWLVKSLHQRAGTILKVAAEIVRRQDGFFRHGIQSLRPLTLREVADAISMHESTVSRVTSNKYISSPRGLYELKYFFTSAIAAADGGDAHSAEAVRFRIRGLIDDEAPDATLSDERIVEMLQHEGVDIARRTVAKYREAMHIPSSVQRRREKSMSL